MNEMTIATNILRARADKRAFNNMISEIKECAKEEDTPIYLGDKEVDCFVRLSHVLEVIDKYSN